MKKNQAIEKICNWGNKNGPDYIPIAASIISTILHELHHTKEKPSVRDIIRTLRLRESMTLDERSVLVTQLREHLPEKDGEA